jgi:hypothetical protein
MPDGQRPEELAFSVARIEKELAFSVARIEKSQRKAAVREQFQAGARIWR